MSCSITWHQITDAYRHERILAYATFVVGGKEYSCQQVFPRDRPIGEVLEYMEEMRTAAQAKVISRVVTEGMYES